ncbi:MAG: ribonuclease HI [Caldilineaceae bacterium]
MSRKKKEYYVVVKGRNTGFYSNWVGMDEAYEQVNGFPGAIYKGFYTRDEAISWLAGFSIETLIELAPNLVEYVDNNVTPQPTIPALFDSPDTGKTPLANGAKQSDQSESRKEVILFTDGACEPNPGQGGYGVVLIYGKHRRELMGGYRLTTNNRMELLASIQGLEALKEPCKVKLYSDSQYLVNAINLEWVNRWKSKNWQKVKNADLWKKLLEQCEKHQVKFAWIKGHAGNINNERCDLLATRASKSKNLMIDVVYEATSIQNRTDDNKINSKDILSSSSPISKHSQKVTR